MATFSECLYNASKIALSPKEICKWHLSYICCNPHGITACDGKRIYQGFPKEYPWAELLQNTPKVDTPYNPLVNTPLNCVPPAQVFLKPDGKTLKPKGKSKAEIDFQKGYLVALGTEWEIQVSGVCYPPYKKVLPPGGEPKFFPLDTQVWKSIVKHRTLLSGCPEAPEARLLRIQKSAGKIVACPVILDSTPTHHPLFGAMWTLSEKADQLNPFVYWFDFSLFPCHMEAPKEIGFWQNLWCLRNGRQKLSILRMNYSEEVAD